MKRNVKSEKHNIALKCSSITALCLILFLVSTIMLSSGCQKSYSLTVTSTEESESLTEKETSIQESAITETAIEKSVTEEPVDEEPVDEEPVDEEPVDEEPVDEEPVDEEPVDEEPVTEEPVDEEPVDERPVDEKLVTEEPVTEKSVDEEPVVKEPVIEISAVTEEPPEEKTSLTGDEWYLILVNPWNLLPEDFSVDIVEFHGGYIDARIYDIAEEMFEAAARDGMNFKLSSGYRSRETQEKLFEKKVKYYIDKGYNREKAETKAATITARPDTSEHQTGLALDIVAVSYPTMNTYFADSAEFGWLTEHAADYGFIMRYPDEKLDVTGVIYEPWHWRYVGEEVAHYINESKLCYEEYYLSLSQ